MEIFKHIYGGRGFPSVFVHPAGGGLPTKILTTGPAEKVIARLERFKARDSAGGDHGHREARHGEKRAAP